MPSSRAIGRMAGPLALIALALVAPARPASAGPISEIMARHRMRQQMRIPPMEKPFSTRPVKDLNAPGMAERFRKRFSLMRPMGGIPEGGMTSSFRDGGVTRTSR